MPNPTSPEAAEIEAAYKEQLRALFKTLFTNLTDRVASDQQCAERFKNGLKVLTKARELALNAVAAPSAAPPSPAVADLSATVSPRRTRSKSR
jgi:DNA-binding IclR family transcriptional regulator